jgi:hypothetical protein
MGDLHRHFQTLRRVSENAQDLSSKNPGRHWIPSERELRRMLIPYPDVFPDRARDNPFLTITN